MMSHSTQNIREVKQLINGLLTSDGDGVQLTRVIGSPQLDMLDPFLLFDAFGSDKPQDYIGGFPPHPHRGFETVTYMLAGKMRHQDSAGNAGVIEAGGVQWMSAGSGIIHSEMPEQEEGLLAGFQLWVNLPASEKMSTPKYQEYDQAHISEEKINTDSFVSVVAGKTRKGTNGVIINEAIEPIYWVVNLTAESSFEEDIPAGHNAFIYLFEGAIKIGEGKTSVEKGQLAVLENGEQLLIETSAYSRFLVVAGKPLNESVERAGPFVMNTREEIQQAFADYQSGNLVAVA